MTLACYGALEIVGVIIIIIIIELISSACGTTQDALWIVTFLLGLCLRTFINSF